MGLQYFLTMSEVGRKFCDITILFEVDFQCRENDH